jgi:Flp pilus assembly protein TadD
MNAERHPSVPSLFDPQRLRAFAHGKATLAELVGMPHEHVRRLCAQGERMLRFGQAAKAVTWLKGVVALAPFDARVHAALGVALLRSKELEGAEVHLRRALAIRPGADDVRVTLAELLLLTRRKPEALEHLRAVPAAGAASRSLPARRASLLLSVHQPRPARGAPARLLSAR